MDSLLDLIMAGLEPIFGIKWVAPLIMLPLILAGAFYLCVQAEKKTQPVLKAIDDRLNVLKSILGGHADPIDARNAFAVNFQTIDAALTKSDPGAPGLSLAWLEFHETMIDETETPIRNTNRPSVYFARSTPSQGYLIFWSNFFVGIGLLLTFLGLIVALHTARQGMGADDPKLMQEALKQLLTVAGAKFFTSVAGISASLILKIREHRLTRSVKVRIDELCSLLERGLLYTPLQKIAAEQLAVMKEQTNQLKVFNTDFALQLSERIGTQFQNAIQPVTASLGLLNESINSMSQGLGQGAARAVAEASGGELRALGQTLATLGEKLSALSTTVSSSGDDAARQIRMAGEDFAGAARDIREAFSRLTENVESLGGKLHEQSETATQVQNDAFGRVIANLETAQARSVETMGEAIKALQAAGAEAATTMQGQVTQALATGVTESQQIFRVALEESGESLRAVSGNLSRAVGDAAEKIEAASTGFVKSGEGASRTAEAMDAVIQRARALELAFEKTSQSVVIAISPITQALQSVNDAAGRIVRAMETGAQSEADALKAMQALAEGMKQAHTAASEAWNNYRQRFEGVDKALEATVVQLGNTLGDTLGEFRKFAQNFDNETARAISRLNMPIATIEDYAEALGEYTEETRKSRTGTA